MPCSMSKLLAPLVGVALLPLATCFSCPALPGASARHVASMTPLAGRVPLRPATRPASLGLFMADETAVENAREFVAADLTVEKFWAMSIGKWKGLRSSHNIAFAQLEEVNSDMTIVEIGKDDEELVEICKTYGFEPEQCASALRVSWVSTSDWDDFEKETIGSSVVAIVKTEGDRVGKVLRSIGYTEEIPAAGDWELRDDGSFYMKTIYTGTGAEETFWFATPDLRMRVSTIKSKGGKGVTTATFTTELRQKS